ncbi:hypothetical protein HYH02_008476 [Chlamydomonas schloesseri]|uniref:Uncharacterized protein n=1 Tax=Chlamydomonas schloesseri TaxID=2026947 RepID=A0A835WFH8_9CHLO|nr:hypothetical protein HYH02_008476 [Chlamydomonas schloesseri]|eukprot:KAG2446485.1 hypothetical protein HYH02_008476 [Chlamydomonas schloesseri]
MALLQSGRLGARHVPLSKQASSAVVRRGSPAATHQRATHIVRANGDRGPGAFGNDGNSDVVFVAKLAAVSFGGAALIKYGSLVLDVPFEPNGLLAMTLVLGPPIAYAALMYTQPK